MLDICYMRFQLHEIIFWCDDFSKSFSTWVYWLIWSELSVNFWSVHSADFLYIYCLLAISILFFLKLSQSLLFLSHALQKCLHRSISSATIFLKKCVSISEKLLITQFRSIIVVHIIQTKSASTTRASEIRNQVN